MKSKFHFSFTPSLLGSEALEALFVQREDIADRIVELACDSIVNEAKYHFLLVGPRGIGKTHLVSLVYHRVKAMCKNQEKLLIAWLHEDSWGIASFLDLLVQILQSIQKEYDDEGLLLEIEKIFEFPPAQAEQAATTLLKNTVSDKTLFLIVENLDGLFEGIGDMGQKRLRAFLQENPFCTILATSPSLFSGVSQQTSPFYGFFATHHLSEFDFEKALAFLIKIAKYKNDKNLTSFLRTPHGRARVRAVHHLAGGNPRVYTIFAQFLNRSSMERLVEPFMRAMDDLTPYYQARMSLLSPQQRKITELLCDRRGAITVKEIAQRCFITHQTASGQLKLLREMRYVNSTAIGRESYYELNEPLMRICLEVKKHRGEPLRLFVEFLRCWYTRPELESLLEMSSKETKIESQYIKKALVLSNKESQDPRVTSCQKDLERLKDKGLYEKALSVLDELDAIDSVNGDSLLERGEILTELDKYEEAIEAYNQAIGIHGTETSAWFGIGYCYMKLSKYEDALLALDKVIALGVDSPPVWGVRGVCLQELDRHELAVNSFKNLVKNDPKDEGGWEFMGKSLYLLGRFDEAAKAFGKAFGLDKTNRQAIEMQFLSLMSADEYTKAMSLGTKHDALLSKSTIYIGAKAITLTSAGRDTEALTFWQEIIDKGDDSSFINLGKVGSLIALQRWDDADIALEEALTKILNPKSRHEVGTSLLLEKFFKVKQDADFWHRGLNIMVTRFAKHDALSFLAAGLVQNVDLIVKKSVSRESAILWHEEWKRSSAAYPEMELALRLIDVAVKYRDCADRKLLMELPIEERKILEEALEKMGKRGDIYPDTGR